MTPEQIKTLAASPFAHIGSHGYYHNDLAFIDIKNAADEMLRSKKYLENLLQKPVDSLAFPYGSYTAEVVTEAKKAGYSKLLATDFCLADSYTDTAMRERFTVNPFISTPNQMHAILSGKYIL